MAYEGHAVLHLRHHRHNVGMPDEHTDIAEWLGVVKTLTLAAHAYLHAEARRDRLRHRLLDMIDTDRDALSPCCRGSSGRAHPIHPATRAKPQPCCANGSIAATLPIGSSPPIPPCPTSSAVPRRRARTAPRPQRAYRHLPSRCRRAMDPRSLQRRIIDGKVLAPAAAT